MMGKQILSAVEVNSAKSALKLMVKLVKIGAAESPEGLLGTALGITIKGLGTALAKALWAQLTALRATGATETFRYFWQRHMDNGWNTAAIAIRYDPFSGHFWGDITGSLGDLNTGGYPSGTGCRHGFDYWFYGDVGGTGNIVGFFYPNSRHP